MEFAPQKALTESLGSCGIDFVPTQGIVENLRAVKTPPEIKKIRKATAITLDCLEFARELLETSISEKQLYLEIEKFLKSCGDIDMAFDPIVAFGVNTSLPHHIAGTTKPDPQKPCLIDLGAKVSGYCADLTRVCFLGKIPLHLKRIYDIVCTAKDLAIKEIKPGVRACDVDQAARDYITKKGLGKHFGHGLGHGVGVDVHEKPYLNPSSQVVLKENMVVTIEPAVYLASKYGVRVESMVLVKKNKAEVLDGNVSW
jgi:Xaa-Pro aminopeptidase